MKFKIDENLPQAAAELLQSAGFETQTVRDEGLGGKPDEVIAAAVRAEDRVLVTLDRGFGDIRAYPPDTFSGIIVLRPRQRDRSSALTLLRRLIPLLSKEPLAGALWIVEPDRIRFHNS